MGFKSINLNDFEKINPFNLIGNEWMLITAGGKNNFNTMTASWGTMGVLWNKNIVSCFVRPQRYTFKFLEENEIFSISFFDGKHKDALKICGTKSGRDCDKINLAGLTPIFDEKAPYFKESKMTLICKKIYAQYVDPKCMIDENLESNYKLKDYHKMFVGEIIKCLVED